jgi:thiamine biosynthesis lipoprotein
MIAPAVLLLGSLVGPTAPVTEIHYVMGTYLRITADGAGAREAMRRCFTHARRLDGVFSRFDPASELARVHASAGASIPVSPDFAALFRRARALTLATDGAFDVAHGRLTALWRDPNGAPGAAAVAAARRHGGTSRVKLAGDRLRIGDGARLDFDGIAKGYAVDACVALLREAGIARGLVSFGESSIHALGAPEGAAAWTVAVRDVDPGWVVGRLRLRDESLSVSATVSFAGGAGWRGRRHIVDPRTGRRVGGEAVALVATRSATDAEAYSKALLVWGPSRLARVEAASQGAAVYLEAGRVHLGPAARARALFEAFTEARAVDGDEAVLW